MALAEDLYEQDFYAWALEQADVLRRREAGANALDYDNLAEEVEGLGIAELRACESLLRQIVINVPFDPNTLTPSLRLRFEERAAEVMDRQIGTWKAVDRAAAAAWRLTPPTLAECLDEEAFPEPGSGSLRPAEPIQS